MTRWNARAASSEIYEAGKRGPDGGTATPICRLGILFVGQFLDVPGLVVHSLTDFRVLYGGIGVELSPIPQEECGKGRPSGAECSKIGSTNDRQKIFKCAQALRSTRMGPDHLRGDRC